MKKAACGAQRIATRHPDCASARPAMLEMSARRADAETT
jgi:hypothetical protein